MSDLTAGERIQRGAEARRALDAFIDPAFTVLEAEYTEKLQHIAAEQPWETGKISKLAIALRVSREVKGQLLALVLDGEMAQRDTARARKIADLPEARRRLLDVFPHR